jgi:hypothetical protein
MSAGWRRKRITLADPELAFAPPGQVARTRLAERVTPAIQHRVALTDGAEALQTQMLAHVPAYSLVLDRIHASE